MYGLNIIERQACLILENENKNDRKLKLLLCQPGGGLVQ